MEKPQDKENPIYHITAIAQWQKAQDKGIYEPLGFSKEGFIHCSYLCQVIEVANRIFLGQKDLILLEIDREKIDSKIIDENLEGGRELYPHIYGLLPIAAVSNAISFPCNNDGSFTLPAEYK